MATYTIFAGVNGAGKTSIYKSIYYEYNTLFFSKSLESLYIV